MNKTLTKLKRKTKVKLFRVLKISGALVLNTTQYHVDNNPSPKHWNKTF
jgi:hypothetical protein